MKCVSLKLFIFIVTLDLISPQCTLSKNSLTDTDRDKLLSKHNELRNKLAAGKEGDLPAAKNIEEMEWNSELAELAQKYANTCPSDHNPNRKTKSYSQTGENLYWAMSSDERDVDYSEAVQSWYNEVKDFTDKSKIKSFQSGGGKVTGHFTQVIWHDSSKLGCGVNSYRDGSWYKTVVVCNYYKAGNFIGNSIYDEGSQASGCSKKSAKYTALCVSESGSSNSDSKGAGGDSSSDGKTSSSNENSKKSTEDKTSEASSQNTEKSQETASVENENNSSKSKGETDTQETDKGSGHENKNKNMASTKVENNEADDFQVRALKKGKDWRDPRWDSWNLGGTTSDEMMKIQGKFLQQIKNKIAVDKSKFREKKGEQLIDSQKEVALGSKFLDEIIDVIKNRFENIP